MNLKNSFRVWSDLSQFISLFSHKVLDTQVWLRLSWTDNRLTWNSSQFGGIESLKGSLISEGIFTLVPLSTKSAKSLPRAENLNLPPLTVHCWKKKRDLLIIRRQVGGLVTQSVADNEYFICCKDKMLHKYHQKQLPIICECKLMFIMQPTYFQSHLLKIRRSFIY